MCVLQLSTFLDFKLPGVGSYNVYFVVMDQQISLGNVCKERVCKDNFSAE
jgi:hypothetical protein